MRAQPIRGEFVAEQVQSLVTASESSPIFDWVTAIPLSPFRALQGVDQGAQAIREFNDTAMEMSRIVASMPRLIRWNLELLALDVSQQGDIESSLESFDALARSARVALADGRSRCPRACARCSTRRSARARASGRSRNRSSARPRRWRRPAPPGAGSSQQLEQAAGGSERSPRVPSTSASGSRRPRRSPRRPRELRALLDSVSTLAGSDDARGRRSPS